MARQLVGRQVLRPQKSHWQLSQLSPLLLLQQQLLRQLLLL